MEVTSIFYYQISNNGKRVRDEVLQDTFYGLCIEEGNDLFNDALNTFYLRL